LGHTQGSNWATSVERQVFGHTQGQAGTALTEGADGISDSVSIRLSILHLLAEPRIALRRGSRDERAQTGRMTGLN
jgi:hypothetical protein